MLRYMQNHRLLRDKCPFHPQTVYITPSYRLYTLWAHNLPVTKQVLSGLVMNNSGKSLFNTCYKWATVIPVRENTTYTILSPCDCLKLKLRFVSSSHSLFPMCRILVTVEHVKMGWAKFDPTKDNNRRSLTTKCHYLRCL